MARNLSGGRGRGRGRRYSREPRIRKNERIRAREVRVVGPQGNQIGVMATHEARKLAREVGLDLVEIAPRARPPVCKIIDFGKYMYEQSKKTKDQKSKGTTSKLKEVKLRVRIEQHDYMFKMKHAEEFLHKGNKVKLSLMYRGRENEHKELGFDVVKRAIADLDHVGHAEHEPRLAGRNLSCVVVPHPVNKRKLKYNTEEDLGQRGDPDDDDDYDDDEDEDEEDADDS